MVLQKARKSNKEAEKMSETDEEIVDMIQYFIEIGWWCIKHDKGKTFTWNMSTGVPDEPICTECMIEEQEENELYIEEMSLLRAILFLLALPFLLLLGVLFDLKGAKET